MTRRGLDHARGSLPSRLIVVFATMAICGAGRAPAAEVSPDQRPAGSAWKATEAGRHFHRGIDLYDDGDLSGAAVEFSRAYQIVPSFKILYNLGQISYQQQDYVAALDNFRRYLAEGRDQIPTERKKQVEEDVRRLDQRIGRLEVDTRDDGSEILVDGVTVGTSPLWEIAANVGRRRVEVVSKSGARQVRAVDVVGGETTHVRFEATVVARVPAPHAGSFAPILAPTLRAKSGAPIVSPSPLSEARAERSEPSRRPLSRGAWVAWSAVCLLGAGSAVTGALAYSASRDLQVGRDSFPISAGSLDPYRNRVQVLGWTSDGLLAGTVLMAALASYLTFRGPSEAPPQDEMGLNE